MAYNLLMKLDYSYLFSYYLYMMSSGLTKAIELNSLSKKSNGLIIKAIIWKNNSPLALEKKEVKLLAIVPSVCFKKYLSKQIEKKEVANN